MSDLEKRACESYCAYAKVTDWKNYQGLPMPEWVNLPDKIKEAWKAAIKCARQHVLQEVADYVYNEIILEKMGE